MKRSLKMLCALCMMAGMFIPVRAEEEEKKKEISFTVLGNGGYFGGNDENGDFLLSTAYGKIRMYDDGSHYASYYGYSQSDYVNHYLPTLTVVDTNKYWEFVGYGTKAEGPMEFETMEDVEDALAADEENIGKQDLKIYAIFKASKEDTAACRVFGFCEQNGKKYWYERGLRQGAYGDSNNLTDVQFDRVERGREIYDPESNGWYWLDAAFEGAAAYDKEVWMPYVFQDEAMGITDGKWVRYDANGKMIKGWHDNRRYYYDLLTGEMAKGNRTVGSEVYFFDPMTGVSQGLAARSLADDDWRMKLARSWCGDTEGHCEYWAARFSEEIVGFAEYTGQPNLYEISRDELRVGDLIGYHSSFTDVWHVCIYLDDKMAFHGNYSVNGVPQTAIAPWPTPGSTGIKFFRANHNMGSHYFTW